MSVKATVYLDPRILKAAKIKAACTDTSLSHLVNEALRYSLREDAMDQEAIKTRVCEPTRSFEAVLKSLKRDGLL